MGVRDNARSYDWPVIVRAVNTVVDDRRSARNSFRDPAQNHFPHSCGSEGDQPRLFRSFAQAYGDHRMGIKKYRTAANFAAVFCSGGKLHVTASPRRRLRRALGG